VKKKHVNADDVDGDVNADDVSVVVVVVVVVARQCRARRSRRMVEEEEAAPPQSPHNGVVVVVATFVVVVVVVVVVCLLVLGMVLFVCLVSGFLIFLMDKQCAMQTKQQPVARTVRLRSVCLSVCLSASV